MVPSELLIVIVYQTIIVNLFLVFPGYISANLLQILNACQQFFITLTFVVSMEGQTGKVQIVTTTFKF